jgi:hypothetical protein
MHAVLSCPWRITTEHGHRPRLPRLTCRLASPDHRGPLRLRPLCNCLFHLSWLGLLDVATVNAVAPQLTALLREAAAAGRGAAGAGRGDGLDPDLDSADLHEQEEAAAMSAASASGSANGPSVPPPLPPSVVVRTWRVLSQARLAALQSYGRARAGGGGSVFGHATYQQAAQIDGELLTAMRAALAPSISSMSLYQITGVLQSMAQIGSYSFRFVAGLTAAANKCLEQELLRRRAAAAAAAAAATTAISSEVSSSGSSNASRDDGGGGGGGSGFETGKFVLAQWLHRLTWAVAVLKHHDPELVTTLCDAAVELGDEMDPAASSVMLGNLAQLNHRHGRLLAELGRRLTPEAPRLLTLNLATLAASCAYLDHYDGPLLAAVASELEKRAAVPAGDRAGAERELQRRSEFMPASYKVSDGGRCRGLPYVSSRVRAGVRRI